MFVAWAVAFIVLQGLGEMSERGFRMAGDRHHSERELPSCNRPKQPARIIVRSKSAQGGITIGQYYNVTESWVREFFQCPERHLKMLLGIDVSYLSDSGCLTAINELVERHKASWKKSAHQGKILVGLTYILGQTIIRDRPELDWIVSVEEGFIDDIGIGRERAMLRLFSNIARPEGGFILDQHGIDLLIWKSLLTSENLSDIDQENPIMILSTEEEG